MFAMFTWVISDKMEHFLVEKNSDDGGWYNQTSFCNQQSPL